MQLVEFNITPGKKQAFDELKLKNYVKDNLNGVPDIIYIQALQVNYESYHHIAVVEFATCCYQNIKMIFFHDVYDALSRWNASFAMRTAMYSLFAYL